MNTSVSIPQILERLDGRRPRLERADQVAFLVDAAAYFGALRTSLLTARRIVWIIGWDFDPAIKLRPDLEAEPTLGTLLRRLVEQNEELHVKILIWAMGPIYSSRSGELYVHHPWADHPRISLKFDIRHPLRASHHQKIVVIDRSMAFSGGIDLTAGRWDTREHHVTADLRRTPGGERYGPVHDVQIAVSGDAARALAEIAESRWVAAGENSGNAPAETIDRGTWPKQLPVALVDCKVAIARTQGGIFLRRGRREAVRLTLQLIRSARKSLYIETQYLASWRVARAIKDRLDEPFGPEVVILVTKSSRGIVEQYVMAHQRNRILRWLGGANGPRLRVVYRMKSDDGNANKEVLVHSKVIVVDDNAVRIGSSNLNNRSEGLDTECDVVVFAENDEHRRAIAAFRDGLLAEHLETDRVELGQALRECKTLVGTVDHFAAITGSLRTYDELNDGGAPILGTKLFDPSRPFRPFGWLLRRIFGKS
ncbi:phospholipase D-like domain-containing protein [Neoaquamicrobium sediminum]|uniref:Phospholipase D n=1 Tax=Neoaquamicrobium sediminum TaxID=1849104 RepID=A0ABV3X1H8_9HYPH